MVQILTNKDFNLVISSSNKPILVDFFATWCGPCKMVSPVIEKLAEEYKDKVEVVKVDIDESMNIAEIYQVSAVPTLMLFKNGEAIDKIVGMASKNEIIEMINKQI